MHWVISFLLLDVVAQSEILPAWRQLPSSSVSSFLELESFGNMELFSCAATVQDKMVPRGDPSGQQRFEHGNAFRHIASKKQCKLGTVFPFSDQFKELFANASSESDIDDKLYVVDGGCMPNGKLFYCHHTL